MGQTAVRSTRTPRTAEAVEASFRALGFEPGFPPTLAPMARAVDQACARRRVCPACKRRGLGCKPYHKPGAYRVVQVCVCGYGEQA